DPLGMADGPNVYVYVYNDPINMFDPYGLCSNSLWDKWWLIGAGITITFPGFGDDIFYWGIVGAGFTMWGIYEAGKAIINWAKSKGQPDSVDRVERDRTARQDRHAHGKDDKWAINEDGTAHHKRSKGQQIPKDAAEWLRERGFNIPNDRYIP
ncbi:MAG: hypothetical protein ABH952_08770, partial [Candidatus Omnitrophota bacterium]